MIGTNHGHHQQRNIPPDSPPTTSTVNPHLDLKILTHKLLIILLIIYQQIKQHHHLQVLNGCPIDKLVIHVQENENDYNLLGNTCINDEYKSWDLKTIMKFMNWICSLDDGLYVNKQLVNGFK
eukprot:373454_1